MTWLKPSDRGTVELALTYARQIDESLKAVDRVAGLEPEIAKLVLENATKALYLGPHLLNTLRALGGAPAERKALKIEEAARGKLGELRDKAKARGLAVLEGGAAG